MLRQDEIKRKAINALRLHASRAIAPLPWRHVPGRGSRGLRMSTVGATIQKRSLMSLKCSRMACLTIRVTDDQVAD